jgi:ribonuclease P protein component
MVTHFQTLKENREFQHTYKNAKKKYTNCFILFFKESGEAKVGFTASKKVGNAVKRNRAKRRLKALFVLFSQSLKKGTYIIVAKDCVTQVPFADLKRDMRYALKKVHAL